MSLSRQKKVIILLEEELTHFLLGHCFIKIKCHSYGCRCAWLRRWGWKSDQIRLIHKGNDLLINFDIEIPPRPEAGVEYYGIETRSLTSINHRISWGYAIPFLRFCRNAYVHTIIRDMNEGIKWLSQFDTPEGCLQKYLTNENINSNSPTGREVQSYLQELPAALNQVCCLCNTRIEYPSKYSQAIFDVSHRDPIPAPDVE